MSADQAVPHRLLLPSRLHSVPPKQRPEEEGGAGLNASDTSQTGRGSSENTVQQYAVGRQHLQKRNRRKAIIVCKKKENITKGVCEWEERAATDIHTRCRRAGKEDSHSWTSIRYIPTHPL